MPKFEKNNNFGNRFSKGQSGNPAGRPKTALLSDTVRRQLSESDDLEAIAKALIAKAKGGDLEAVKIVFDRLEGKAVARIDADVNVFDWKAAIVGFGVSPEMILQEAVKLLNDADNELNESNFE